MAKYQRVSPKFWQDPKVRRWKDEQKLLAQYLLTCPHRTTEGLFWLPIGYVAQDLGWTIDRASKVLSSLIDVGFVAYDDDTETVFIVKALKYEAPAGIKQIAGAITRLSDVPPSPLFAQLRDAAERFAPEFGAALDRAVKDSETHGYRYGIDTPSIPGLRSSPSSSSSSSNSNPPVVPPDGGTEQQPRTGRKKRATPLPANFAANDTHRRIARDESVNVNRELVKFRDHAKANDRRQVGWDAAFCNWLRQASDYGTNGRPNPSDRPSGTKGGVVG